jgi:hypothetical protein
MIAESPIHPGPFRSLEGGLREFRQESLGASAVLAATPGRQS